VRREDDDGVVVDILQFACQSLVTPTQGLPAAFGDGFVLFGIVSVDEVRWMWRKATHDDFTHVITPPIGRRSFNAPPLAKTQFPPPTPPQ